MEGDSEMEVSIANPTLTYLSIYDATGERVTSFVTGVHGDTVEELQAKAEAEYPDKIHVVQEALTYNKALQGDLLYKDGAYQAKPQPTEEELQAQALASLDSEYQRRFDELDEQIVKAAALKNTELQDELIAEREALAEEYAQKRGEL